MPLCLVGVCVCVFCVFLRVYFTDKVFNKEFNKDFNKDFDKEFNKDFDKDLNKDVNQEFNRNLIKMLINKSVRGNPSNTCAQLAQHLVKA